MRRLIQAEWRVLIRRNSARGLLLVSTVIPVLVAAILRAVSESEMVVNDQSVADIVSFSGPHTANLSLRVRHALVMPILLLFVTGSSFATERQNRMMRERLVRPVSRNTLLFAKLVAVLFLSASSLILNALIAVPLGSLLMGSDGPWWLMFAGHAASLLSDLGIISLGVLLSTVCRSGAMVVVSGILIYVFDQAMNAGLFLVGLAGVDGTTWIQHCLPSTGWNVWTIILGENGWVSALNLLAWTSVFLFLSRRRLNRQDVP